MEALLQNLAPVVIGALVSVIMGLLKKFTTAVAGLPGLVQSLLVVLISFGATWVSGKLGVPVPADLSGWTGDVVNTILTALAAMGIHAIYKGTLPPATK